MAAVESCSCITSLSPTWRTLRGVAPFLPVAGVCTDLLAPMETSGPDPALGSMTATSSSEHSAFSQSIAD